MDDLTQLFIRACKSRNPKARVKSVYRRFYQYCDREREQGEYDGYISRILLDICIEHDLLSIHKLIDELDPDYYMKKVMKDARGYREQVIDLCISAIRLTKKDDLKGLRPPLRFRKP